jgi:hypothetical protein
LFVFPAGLLLPIALHPELVTVHLSGALRFALIAIGLMAYLFGASVFTFFSEPPPPERLRLLSSAGRTMPGRWQRRFRIYRWLNLLAVVFPLVLLYFVNFHQPNQEALRRMFPGRSASLATLFNIGAVGFWILLFLFVWMGILRPHRTGDRDLTSALMRLRIEARLGRPRPAFYFGVIVAVIAMGLLLLSK